MYLVLLFVVALVVVASGCVSCPFMEGESASETKGSLSLGSEKDAISTTIGTSGGSAAVSGTGSAVDGLSLDVPAGAFDGSTSVRISYTDITGHTFGEYFEPVSPLITIEAGTGYSDEPMLLKIPVDVSVDKFVAAFFYDAASGSLEGIPVVERGEGFVTVATRHFSGVVASAINRSRLDSIPEANTDYSPGRDDWQFVNHGSVIADAGHCAGQSISSMWYFEEKRMKENKPALYGYYDNNLHVAGDAREGTRGLWEDDVFGYRLASMTQSAVNETECARVMDIPRYPGKDKATFDEFKYQMLVTKMPQFVGVDVNESGHALVAYKVKDNYVYVADPNYPGDFLRSITLKTLTGGGYEFEPYRSGSSYSSIQSGKGKAYVNISYLGVWALVPKDNMGRLWADFEARRIGSGTFDDYQYELVVTEYDSQGTKALETKFTDGGLNDNLIAFEVTNPEISVRSRFVSMDDLIPLESKVVAITFEGADVKRTTVNDSNRIRLKSGVNRIGIANYLVELDGTSWAGFDWLYITYKPSEERELLTYVDYHPNNVKKTEYTYYTNPQAPQVHVMHGICRSWHNNGVLKSERNYTDGKLHGLALLFFADGGKQTEAQYVNGKRNGYFRTYSSSNGEMTEDTNYVDDLKDGVSLTYFTGYDNVGQVNYKRTYVKGKQEGAEYHYYPTGELCWTDEYRNDKQHGTQTRYYKSGQLYSVIVLADGIKTSETYYNEDGSTRNSPT